MPYIVKPVTNGGPAAVIKVAPLVLAALTTVAYYSFAIAENTEHDACACKVVEVGATSTLRGGTCVRTEASNCLMEWSAGSDQAVNVGDGSSQNSAAEKAFGIVTKGIVHIEKLAPASGDTPFHVAISNLSNVPPEKYGKDIHDSYVFVAATALTRFNVEVDGFAQSLISDPRLLPAIQSRDYLNIEGPLPVRVTYGCLQINGDRQPKPFRIYIKTPFASTASC